MTPTFQNLLWPLAGYLFGSIASAILVSKFFSLDDPRSVGSGNPGATNVLRSGNRLAAFLTLSGDLLKGFLPTWLAFKYTNSYELTAVVAIAAFLGHLYPIFFGGKGGKGVATAIGIFIAFSWQLALVFIAVWGITAVVSKYSSLSALLAAAASAIVSFIIFDSQKELAIIGATLFIVAFLFARHRENIDKMRAGTEKKIGKKTKT